MPRLDEERQAKLEPKRMSYARDQLQKLGFTVTYVDHTQLIFFFNGHEVKFWPYSGWHTGKTIEDGRGLKHLIDQIQEGEKL